MQTVTIPQITELLGNLSTDKLAVVYDFVSYLAEQEKDRAFRESVSETYQTVLATEAALRKGWDRPEEDAAWANL